MNKIELSKGIEDLVWRVTLDEKDDANENDTKGNKERYLTYIKDLMNSLTSCYESKYSLGKGHSDFVNSLASDFQTKRSFSGVEILTKDTIILNNIYSVLSLYWDESYHKLLSRIHGGKTIELPDLVINEEANDIKQLLSIKVAFAGQQNPFEQLIQLSRIKELFTFLDTLNRVGNSSSKFPSLVASCLFFAFVYVGDDLIQVLRESIINDKWELNNRLLYSPDIICFNITKEGIVSCRTFKECLLAAGIYDYNPIAKKEVRDKLDGVLSEFNSSENFSEQEKDHLAEIIYLALSPSDESPNTKLYAVESLSMLLDSADKNEKMKGHIGEEVISKLKEK